MSKTKDDWMYPQRHSGWQAQSREPPKEFIIQRMKAAPVTTWMGSPPRPTWEEWDEFDTEAERDAELVRLRQTTEWRLRPARRSILGGQVWDVEVDDEESDLLARLEMLRLRRKRPK